MKKSTIYRLAQCAVLNCTLCDFDKLEIIHELMEKESVEKFVEEREEKENANETV